MVTATPTKLAELYRIDETAWLEAMAELIRSGRLDEVDYPNLAEYLSDMVIRDRREVAGSGRSSSNARNSKNGSRAAYCETTQ